LYGVTTWLDFQYRKQLSIATLVGITELSPIGQQKGRLPREGIYGVVRHPRYLSAGIAVIANAMLINYAGLYISMLSLVPVGHWMIVLEERELMERFGDEYRKYQREVPRLIPRWRKTN
jgi:protein-S-isoprenylcysteine O-methyltransferase Ste14